VPNPVKPASSGAYDPNEMAGARVLARCGRFGIDEAVVWEHEVAANRPYLPRMQHHTVSLCRHQLPVAVLTGFPLSQTTRGDEWSLLIVPAGEGCQLQAHSAANVWSVGLSPAMLLRAQRNGPPGSPSTHRARLPRLLAGAGVNDIVLRSLLLALHHGVRGSRPAKPLFVDSMASALAAHLVEQHCSPMSAAPDQLGGQAIARLNAFLDSQFSESCSADDAAEMLGLTTSQFLRLLKTQTGQSFQRYCMQRRLERSFQLLHSGQMNVTEAAMETCFASLAHFSRVFHKHFGVPPSALKR
jgi:AraC family transcriptional regulator